MNKHLSTKAFIFSVLIILTLGLIAITGFYFFINNESKPLLPILAGPVTSEPTTLTLRLSSPGDNILVFDPELLIQGKTLAGSLVVLSANNKDQILETDKEGDFSATLKLQKGLNRLVVGSFDSQGNSKNETRAMYYSTEKL